MSDTLIKIAFSLLFLLGGVAVGGFLNELIYRIPRKIPIFKSLPSCPLCNERLRGISLVPLVGWVASKGKCRSCGGKISARGSLIELLCGGLYLAAFYALGLDLRLLFCLVLFPALICVSIIDIDFGIIPYRFTIIIAALGLLSFLLPDEMPWYEHLIGAAIISVPFAVFAFLGVMGGGDVQLCAAAGLLLGWRIVPAALIGIVLGAIFGVILKAVKKSEKGGKMSFGPYLAVGIAVSYLFGTGIIEWYVGLIR